MATAWRYRLFRMNRLPAALAEVAAAPGTLVAAPGVSVRAVGRSVRAPGVRGYRSAHAMVGPFVLRGDRVVAALGQYVVLDAPFDGPQTPGQSITLDADGLHVHVELSSLWPEGKGTLDLAYRQELDEVTLAQVPASCAVSLADGAAKVLR